MFKSIEKALAQMVKFSMPEDQVQISNSQDASSKFSALIKSLQVEVVRECLVQGGWQRSSLSFNSILI